MRDKCVLIVENEVIVADDMARVVGDLGFKALRPAFSFAQAVDLFLSHSPDLVILDIRLASTQSGLDFAHWLRSEHSTPIIYLTVFDDRATRLRCEPTEPTAFISKPFLEHELKKAISKALDIQKNEP